MNIKRVLGAILLIILSIAMTLLLAEGVLRVFKPQPLYSFEKGLFQNSDQYGYCLTPNVEKVHSQPEYSYTIKSNSHGFRGDEPNFLASTRILLIGDSFGMGQGVQNNEVFTAIAQEHFMRSDVDLNIFNASVSGYGPVNYHNVINHITPEYKPHLVIVLLCWNDVGFNTSLKVKEGYLIIKENASTSKQVREWLNNNSHLFCLIKRFYYTIKLKRTAKRELSNPRYGDKKIDAMVKQLAEMKRISNEHDARFIVVMTPLESAYRGTSEFFESKESLLKGLESAGVSFIDWEEVLPDTNREDLIYKVDHHWNKHGHKFFSNYLINMIYDHKGSE